MTSARSSSTALRRPRRKPAARPAAVLPVPPPPLTSARAERLRYIFNRCALELDSSGLRPALTLAEEFGWHRSTFWKWAEAGRMPKPKARVLANRFGLALDFTAEELSGEES